jgi:hypothetical protein
VQSAVCLALLPQADHARDTSLGLAFFRIGAINPTSQ